MITFAVQKNNQQVTLSLPVEDGNEYSLIGYDGDETLVSELFNRLDGAYGAFGHPIALGNTTAIDLDYALSQMPDYQVEITEGAEMVAVYDPKIPADAVT